MSAKTLYRSAAVLFVLFATGHTFGFLRFKPPTAAALAVHDAMTNVHFQVGHASFTYGGFFTFFGLYITLYLLFSSFLSWQLAAMADDAPRSARRLAWAFCGVQVAGLILSLIYFAAPPAVMSGLLVVCLGWAALKVGVVSMAAS